MGRPHCINNLTTGVNSRLSTHNTDQIIINRLMSEGMISLQPHSVAKQDSTVNCVQRKSYTDRNGTNQIITKHLTSRPNQSRIDNNCQQSKTIQIAKLIQSSQLLRINASKEYTSLLSFFNIPSTSIRNIMMSTIATSNIRKNHQTINVAHYSPIRQLVMTTTISMILIMLAINSNILIANARGNTHADSTKIINNNNNNIKYNNNNNNQRHESEDYYISPLLNADEDLIDRINTKLRQTDTATPIQTTNQQKSSSNLLNRQNDQPDSQVDSQQQQEYEALKAEIDALEDQLALASQNQIRLTYDKTPVAATNQQQPSQFATIDQYNQDTQDYQQDSGYVPKDEISRSSSVLQENDAKTVSKTLPERSKQEKPTVSTSSLIQNTMTNSNNTQTSLFIGQLESSPPIQDTPTSENLEDDYYPMSQSATNEDDTASSLSRVSNANKASETTKISINSAMVSGLNENKVVNSAIDKSADSKANNDLEVSAQTQILNSNSRRGFDFGAQSHQSNNPSLISGGQFQMDPTMNRPQMSQFNQQDPSTSTLVSVENVWRPQVNQELNQQYNRARNLQIASASRFDANDGENSQPSALDQRPPPHHVHFTGHSFLPTASPIQPQTNNREFKFQQPGAAASGPLISVLSNGDNGGGHHSVTWNPPPTINPPTLGLQTGQQPQINGNQFPLPVPQFGPLSPLPNIQPFSNNARAPARFESSPQQNQPRFENQPARFENQAGQPRFPENSASNRQRFDDRQQGPSSQFETTLTEAAPRYNEQDVSTISSKFESQPKDENLPTRPPSPLFNNAFQNSRNVTFNEQNMYNTQPSVDRISESINGRPQPPPVASFDNRDQSFRPNQWTAQSPLTSSKAENIEKVAFDSQPKPILKAPQPQLAYSQTFNKPSAKQQANGPFTTSTRSSLDVTTPAGNEGNTTKKEDVVIYYYYYYDDNKNATVVAMNGTSGSSNHSSPSGTILEDGLEDTPYMDDPMTVPSTSSAPGLSDKSPKLSAATDSTNSFSTRQPISIRQQTPIQIQTTTPTARLNGPTMDSLTRSSPQNTLTTTSSPTPRVFTPGTVSSVGAISAINNQKLKPLATSNQNNKIHPADLELSTSPPSSSDTSMITTKPSNTMQSEPSRFQSQRQSHIQAEVPVNRIASTTSAASSHNIRQNNDSQASTPATPKAVNLNANQHSALINSVLSGGVSNPGQRLKSVPSSTASSLPKAISSSNTLRYGTNNNVAVDPYGLDPAAPASLPHSSLSSVDQQRTRMGSHTNPPTSFHLPNYNQRHPNPSPIDQNMNQNFSHINTQSHSQTPSSIFQSQIQNSVETALTRINKTNNTRPSNSEHQHVAPTQTHSRQPSPTQVTAGNTIYPSPQANTFNPKAVNQNHSPQHDNRASIDGSTRTSPHTPRRIQPASLPTSSPTSDVTPSPVRSTSTSSSRESTFSTSGTNQSRVTPARVSSSQRGTVTNSNSNNNNQLIASSQIDEQNNHMMNKMESHNMRTPHPMSTGPNGRASSSEGNIGNSFTPVPVQVSVTSSTSVTSTTASSLQRAINSNNQKLSLVASSVNAPASLNTSTDIPSQNMNFQQHSSNVNPTTQTDPINSSNTTVQSTTTSTTTTTTPVVQSTSPSSPSSSVPSVATSSTQPETSSTAQSESTQGTTIEGTTDPSNRRRLGLDRFGTRRNPFTSRITSNRGDSQNTSVRSTTSTTTTTTTPAPSTTRRASVSTTRRANRQFFAGRRRLGGSDPTPSPPVPAAQPAPAVAPSESSSEHSGSSQPIVVDTSSDSPPVSSTAQPSAQPSPQTSPQSLAQPSQAPSRSRFGSNNWRGRPSSTSTTTITSTTTSTTTASSLTNDKISETTQSSTTQKPNLFTGARGRPTARARLPFLRGRNQGSEDTAPSSSTNPENSSPVGSSTPSAPVQTQPQPSSSPSASTSVTLNEETGNTDASGSDNSNDASLNSASATNIADVENVSTSPAPATSPATASTSNDQSTSLNDRNRTKLRALFASRQRNSTLFGNRQRNS